MADKATILDRVAVVKGQVKAKCVTAERQLQKITNDKSAQSGAARRPVKPVTFVKEFLHSFHVDKNFCRRSLKIGDSEFEVSKESDTVFAATIYGKDNKGYFHEYKVKRHVEAANYVTVVPVENEYADSGLFTNAEECQSVPTLKCEFVKPTLLAELVWEEEKSTYALYGIAHDSDNSESESIRIKEPWENVGGEVSMYFIPKEGTIESA